jgi:hypothetical protein
MADNASKESSTLDRITGVLHDVLDMVSLGVRAYGEVQDLSSKDGQREIADDLSKHGKRLRDVSDQVRKEKT